MPVVIHVQEIRTAKSLATCDGHPSKHRRRFSCRAGSLGNARNTGRFQVKGVSSQYKLRVVQDTEEVLFSQGNTHACVQLAGLAITMPRTC
eukprot:3797209-Amphidinium_carterae.1